MKKLFLLSLIMVFSFIGCATQGSVQKDSEAWNSIKSTDDCRGKWEGKVVSYIPKNEKQYIPSSSLTVYIYFEYPYNSNHVESYMKVDFNDFLSDWAGVDEIKNAGFSKESLWELLAKEFAEQEEFSNIDNYSVMYDLSDSADSFFSDSQSGKFQINNNKDKVRMIFNTALSFLPGDSGIKEIILEKVQ